MTSVSHMSLAVMLLTLVAFTPSTSASLLFNDLLPIFGLPYGLIPQPMTYFTLTPVGLLSFNFTIYFPKPCYVMFPLLNFYDTEFKGTISPGKITDMQGHKDQFPDNSWKFMYSVEAIDDTLLFTFENATTALANISVFQDIKICQYAPFADQSNNLISQLILAAE